MIQERRWLAATFAAAGVLCASAQEPLRMTMEQLFATAQTLISQTRRRAEQGIALSNDITRHELHGLGWE